MAGIAIVSILFTVSYNCRFCIDISVHCIPMQVFNAWRCVTLTVVDDYSLLVVEEDSAVLSLYFNQWRIKYMQKTHKIR